MGGLSLLANCHQPGLRCMHQISRLANDGGDDDDDDDDGGDDGDGGDDVVYAQCALTPQRFGNYGGGDSYYKPLLGSAICSFC